MKQHKWHKDEALKMAIEEIENWINHVYGSTPKECADNEVIKVCKEALKQPTQEWQRLSDEEIKAIYVEIGVMDFKDVVKAIEQKLKEKNHGTT